MSSFDTGLYENDISPLVRDFYRSCLSEKKSSEDAEQETLEHFSQELSDEDDRIHVLLALADTEWEYGRLSNALKEQALRIIDSGADVASWNEIDVMYGRKRSRTLSRLREKISSPLPEPKSVRKTKPFRCEWSIGDVYAVKMNGADTVKAGLAGKWLILQKVDEADNLKNGISPVVTLRLVDEITSPPYVLLKKPCIRVTRYLGYKWSYRLHLLLYTKRSISDFQFLGNTQLILPQDEHPHPNRAGLRTCIRTFLEDFVVMSLNEFGME